MFYDKRARRSFFMNDSVDTKKSDILIMYFHGNAEDVADNMYLFKQLQETFNCSVLAMEYPGYGFFSHQIIDGKANCKKPMATSPKLIKKCARTVF